MGAFYTYFDSKEAFYAELIALVGQDARTFISRNRAVPRALNALEFELRGLWLWLVYLSIDKHCYNIVREAEFVLPVAVRDYYGAFAAGYRRRPPEHRATCAAPGLDEGHRHRIPHGPGPLLRHGDRLRRPRATPGPWSRPSAATSPGDFRLPHQEDVK